MWTGHNVSTDSIIRGTGIGFVKAQMRDSRAGRWTSCQ